MVLADTSIWIDHFRRHEPALAHHLSQGQVLMHSFIVGELACGNLKDRASILADLQALPVAPSASDAEVMQLIDSHRLWGRGLGWIDVHLLASARLSGCRFWTRDTKLARAASQLGVA